MRNYVIYKVDPTESVRSPHPISNLVIIARLDDRRARKPRIVRQI